MLYWSVLLHIWSFRYICLFGWKEYFVLMQKCLSQKPAICTVYTLWIGILNTVFYSLNWWKLDFRSKAVCEEILYIFVINTRLFFWHNIWVMKQTCFSLKWYRLIKIYHFFILYKDGGIYKQKGEGGHYGPPIYLGSQVADFFRD